MRRAGCIGLGVALLAGCAPAPSGAPADPVRGERLFTAACSGYCHATPAGTGGEAPDLWDCEWIHGDSDPEIFHTISTGVPGTDMPPFGGSLSDADIRNLLVFLRGASRCTPPRAPQAAQSGSV